MERCLILINNSSLGGAERRFGRLFAGMADEDQATLLINSGLWRQLMAAGVVTGSEKGVVRLPEPARWFSELLGLRPGAAFWVRKLDYVLFAAILLVRYGLATPRLFHLCLGGPYVALPLMLLRTSHRMAISVVSADLTLLVGKPVGLILYKVALVGCRLIDTLSETAASDLIGRGISADKVLVSPGSVVNLEHFRPSSEKQPWVVFAGRLVEEKNPLLFLEAIPQISQAVPEAKFFLLGKGPLGSQVEHMVDQLQLRDVVQTRFEPDVAAVLGRASVFVSVQRSDNYPSQSLLEAMACGAVPVATDVGLTWRLVDDTTGVRVKPEASQLAETIIALLRDRPRAAQLGESARRRVAEEHSDEIYRRYLHGLYRRLEAVRSC
jgi:glycosyltransferase involved in cell wall biosynthesis